MFGGLGGFSRGESGKNVCIFVSEIKLISQLYIARLPYVRKKRRKGRGRRTQSLIREYNLLNARLFFFARKKKVSSSLYRSVCVCVWMRDETHRVGWRERKERREKKKNRHPVRSRSRPAGSNYYSNKISSIAFSFIHVGFPFCLPLTHSSAVIGFCFVIVTSMYICM